MKSFMALTLAAVGTVALLACSEAQVVPTVTPSAPVTAPTPVTVAETGDWSAYPLVKPGASSGAETGQEAKIEALEARIASLEGQIREIPPGEGR